ncbi:MAG: peptidylprolyl isomerase [Desulfurivibrionaceae bacterium]
MQVRPLIIALTLLLSFSSSASIAEQEGQMDKNVIMETSEGRIVIDLFEDKAPLTTDNFRQYVEDGFYNGLIFHRVIPGFVIQGGSFEPGMKKRTPRDPIKNEADNGLKNKRGTLSMARTGEIDSATSQFFINLQDNASLDHRGRSPRAYGYAVFGRVTEGMDVVDAIASVPTGRAGRHRDVPREDVVIKKAYLAD